MSAAPKGFLGISSVPSGIPIYPLCCTPLYCLITRPVINLKFRVMSTIHYNFAGELQVTYVKTRQDAGKCTSSYDAAQFLRSIWSDRINYREEFHIILLNRRRHIIGHTRISEGGITGTVVDLRMVFQAALMGNAISIILAHNHPSGNLKPSDHDMRLTRQAVQAGSILSITVEDHIILTDEEHYSFADNGEI